MGYSLRLEVGKTFYDLAEDGLEGEQFYFLDLTFEEVHQVAFHEVETQVNDGSFAFADRTVDNFLDVEDAGVIDLLQDLNLADSCDGEPVVVCFSDIFHFFESILKTID